ncbi:hypothetical protein OS493_000916 [Desmophyllum pertusum]|uniref:Uncharacterized protein n=1 Tax=Desmophyllum pertusum TaxID=174260 RepID=A0A9X0D503_9CNID|nr:hypothetical protein OS493_000916 [Desmophyllum pertusum]
MAFYQGDKSTELGQSVFGLRQHVSFGWLESSQESSAMAFSLGQCMAVNKKLIDSLHIRNHKDKSCKEKYSPATLKEEVPEGNTVAAEQTFVWLSRFNIIVCAMPKVNRSSEKRPGNKPRTFVWIGSRNDTEINGTNLSNLVGKKIKFDSQLDAKAMSSLLKREIPEIKNASLTTMLIGHWASNNIIDAESCNLLGKNASNVFSCKGSFERGEDLLVELISLLMDCFSFKRPVGPGPYKVKCPSSNVIFFIHRCWNYRGPRDEQKCCLPPRRGSINGHCQGHYEARIAMATKTGEENDEGDNEEEK